MARPEDPAPVPGPGEELRAAASDTVRGSRLDSPRDNPQAAEARTVERAQARTAPEPRRPVPPAQRQAPVEPPRAESRVEPTRSDPSRGTAATAPPQERTGRDRPEAAEAPAACGSPTRKPATGPEPTQDAPAASSEPTAADAPAAEKPATDEAPAPEPAAASPQQPAASRRTKKGKPVMPSWDEVLLGVRGQR
jgi:hypothetical protein